MADTLTDMLCAETWHQDSATESYIQFNEEGTGELVCRTEFDTWIAAEIEWKLLDSQKPEENSEAAGNVSAVPKFNPIRRPSFSTPANYGPKPTLIADIDLAITLTKYRLAFASHKPDINEHLLTDEAFQPKKYTARLERGVFHPYELEKLKIIEWYPTYALRLTFDKSPYPPQNQWKKPEGAPNTFEFWEWNVFISQNLPRVTAE